jgi:dTDP-4-amino-4,6-dideoxygalactose transaminase
MINERSLTSDENNLESFMRNTFSEDSFNVQLVDLKAEYEELKHELVPTVIDVLKSGHYINGKRLMSFEDNFSKYIGTNYAVGVNSGSDAIMLALKSVGIGKGDEVITSSHTFISTVDAIVRVGARPVFVDVCADTNCIDPGLIQEKISKKTRAILPIHLYGHPAEMKSITELATENGLILIEDACQAIGAEYDGKKVGSFGDAGCFSFYPTKNIGCYGDGGIIVTDQKPIYKKLMELRNYGEFRKYYYNIHGYNSRLDEIQAAILNIKLKYLDIFNDKRRKNAEIYKNLLGNSNLMLPIEKNHSKHVYYLFVIRCADRDRWQRILFKEGIQTQVYYPIPVHKQKPYLKMGYLAELPVTEQLCKENLALPMHPWLSEEDIIKVVEAIEFADS